MLQDNIFWNVDANYYNLPTKPARVTWAAWPVQLDQQMSCWDSQQVDGLRAPQPQDDHMLHMLEGQAAETESPSGTVRVVKKKK